MKKKVICRTDWARHQPETIKGKVCQVVKEFWYNGEGHYRLKDEHGKTFDSPDVFWSELK